MVYVDTSVAVALFVPEAKTAVIETWFSANNDPPVAADWVTTKFASALSIKERRGDLTPEATVAVWQEFTAFCGTGLRLVPVSRSALADAAHLAREAGSGLRAGDSLHLAVALEIAAAAIATTDGTLARRAEVEGLRAVKF